LARKPFVAVVSHMHYIMGEEILQLIEPLAQSVGYVAAPYNFACVIGVIA
jgi:hypothetical protein